MINQLTDIEIIVSDNASSDDTLDFLNFMQETFSSVLVVNHNESNLGFGGNIEKLVSMAKGKYIWLVGDDDYYNKNCISIIHSLLARDNFDYICLGYSDTEFNSSNIVFSSEKCKTFTSKSELFKCINNAPGFMSCNIFKKQLYQSVFTKNETWRHFVKLLNFPENMFSCYYDENMIYVFRPSENNWYKKIFLYTTEIMGKIFSSNCTDNTKNSLLGIYKKNYFPFCFDACLAGLEIGDSEYIKRVLENMKMSDSVEYKLICHANNGVFHFVLRIIRKISICLKKQSCRKIQRKMLCFLTRGK